MARSRRKTPICGMTTTRSDKWYKVAAHRAERREVRTSILQGREPPNSKQFGNPWDAPKDGDTRFDPVELPFLMRK